MQAETIFAGVRRDRDGQVAAPRGIGRLCQWEQHQATAVDQQQQQQQSSFAEFQRGLLLDCPENGPGQRAGVFSFRPTKDMPGSMYYQVGQHLV